MIAEDALKWFWGFRLLVSGHSVPDDVSGERDILFALERSLVHCAAQCCQAVICSPTEEERNVLFQPTFEQCAGSCADFVRLHGWNDDLCW